MVTGRLTQRLLGRRGYRFTQPMKVATAVAGVRGAVTLAGVLSLPLAMPDGAAFPARDLVIFLATGGHSLLAGHRDAVYCRH